MKTEDIKINTNIESKAIYIIQKKKEEKQFEKIKQKKLQKELKAHKKYIKNCIKAEICPVCGDNLKTLDSLEHKKYKDQTGYDYINFVLICTDHFEHIDGDYYDSDYDD